MTATTAPAKLLPISIAKRIARLANEARETPVREARILRLLSDSGYSAHEIAGLCGVSWNRVDIRLSLLNLSEEAQAEIENGTLPVGLAWYIAQLTPAGQKQMRKLWGQGYFDSFQEAHRYASDLRTAETKAADSNG